MAFWKPTPQDDEDAATIIFDKFILISHYATIFADKTVPEDVIYLCCDYCDLYEEYPELRVQNLSSIYVICQPKEHIFQSVYIASDGYITSSCSLLKLTVIGDLEMDRHALIRMDKHLEYGKIIVNVTGDVNMGHGSCILSPHFGRIYIKCRDLIMKSHANIGTCSKEQIGSNKNTDKISGDIVLKVKRNIILHSFCHIYGGGIRIECRSFEAKQDSNICAFQKNLTMETVDNSANAKGQVHGKLCAKKIAW